MLAAASAIVVVVYLRLPVPARLPHRQRLHDRHGGAHHPGHLDPPLGPLRLRQGLPHRSSVRWASRWRSSPSSTSWPGCAGGGDSGDFLHLSVASSTGSAASPPATAPGWSSASARPERTSSAAAAARPARRTGSPAGGPVFVLWIDRPSSARSSLGCTTSAGPARLRAQIHANEAHQQKTRRAHGRDPDALRSPSTDARRPRISRVPQAPLLRRPLTALASRAG